MPYDYSKLLGKITEVFGTQARFSDAIGLSERSVSLKLNGKRAWKQSEMAKACEVLTIPESELGTYFFAAKVQQF